MRDPKKILIICFYSGNVTIRKVGSYVCLTHRSSVHDSKSVSMSKHTVVSLLTYGCESWNLTQDVIRDTWFADSMGVRCNSQMIIRITDDRDVQTEARSTTSSFDLVKNIRSRRLSFLTRTNSKCRSNETTFLSDWAVTQHHVKLNNGW